MKILSKQLPKHPHQHYIWDSPYFYVVWISASTYPTTKDFVQTFFWEKVWIQNTLPTYGLDICPKFRSFFIWDSLLPYIKITEIVAEPE